MSFWRTVRGFWRDDFLQKRLVYDEIPEGARVRGRELGQILTDYEVLDDTNVIDPDTVKDSVAKAMDIVIVPGSLPTAPRLTQFDGINMLSSTVNRKKGEIDTKFTAIYRLLATELQLDASTHHSRYLQAKVNAGRLKAATRQTIQDKIDSLFQDLETLQKSAKDEIDVLRTEYSNRYNNDNNIDNDEQNELNALAAEKKKAFLASYVSLMALAPPRQGPPPAPPEPGVLERIQNGWVAWLARQGYDAAINLATDPNRLIDQYFNEIKPKVWDIPYEYWSSYGPYLWEKLTHDFPNWMNEVTPEFLKVSYRWLKEQGKPYFKTSDEEYEGSLMGTLDAWYRALFREIVGYDPDEIPSREDQGGAAASGVGGITSYLEVDRLSTDGDPKLHERIVTQIPVFYEAVKIGAFEKAHEYYKEGYPRYEKFCNDVVEFAHIMMREAPEVWDKVKGTVLDSIKAIIDFCAEKPAAYRRINEQNPDFAKHLTELLGYIPTGDFKSAVEDVFPSYTVKGSLDAMLFSKLTQFEDFDEVWDKDQIERIRFRKDLDDLRTYLTISRLSPEQMTELSNRMKLGFTNGKVNMILLSPSDSLLSALKVGADQNGKEVVVITQFPDRYGGRPSMATNPGAVIENLDEVQDCATRWSVDQDGKRVKETLSAVDGQNGEKYFVFVEGGEFFVRDLNGRRDGPIDLAVPAWAPKPTVKDGVSSQEYEVKSGLPPAKLTLKIEKQEIPGNLVDNLTSSLAALDSIKDEEGLKKLALVRVNIRALMEGYGAMTFNDLPPEVIDTLGGAHSPLQKFGGAKIGVLMREMKSNPENKFNEPIILRQIQVLHGFVKAAGIAIDADVDVGLHEGIPQRTAAAPEGRSERMDGSEAADWFKKWGPIGELIAQIIEALGLCVDFEKDEFGIISIFGKKAEGETDEAHKLRMDAAGEMLRRTREVGFQALPENMSDSLKGAVEAVTKTEAFDLMVKADSAELPEIQKQQAHNAFKLMIVNLREAHNSPNWSEALAGKKIPDSYIHYELTRLFLEGDEPCRFVYNREKDFDGAVGSRITFEQFMRYVIGTEGGGGAKGLRVVGVDSGGEGEVSVC